MDKDSHRALMGLGSSGLEMAVLLVIGLFIGKYADEHFGMTPLFTLVGAFTGIVTGFYAVFKTLMAMQKKEDRNGKKFPPGTGSI